MSRKQFLTRLTGSCYTLKIGKSVYGMDGVLFFFFFFFLLLSPPTPSTSSRVLRYPSVCCYIAQDCSKRNHVVMIFFRRLCEISMGVCEILPVPLDWYWCLGKRGATWDLKPRLCQRSLLSDLILAPSVFWHERNKPPTSSFTTIRSDPVSVVAEQRSSAVS